MIKKLKPKLFLFIGIALLLIAAVFFLCHIYHPSFPSAKLLWMSYVQWICIDLMRVSFFTAIVLKSVKVVKNKFILAGIILFSFGVMFFFFAINHPELDFPWSNVITHAIYRTYIGLTIAAFAIGIITKIVKIMKNRNLKKEK